MEEHHCQLQVRVGDGATQIGNSDQLPDDVGGLLHLPGKGNAVFIGVDPDPPGALYRGVCVAYTRRVPVDKLG